MRIALLALTAWASVAAAQDNDRVWSVQTLPATDAAGNRMDALVSTQRGEEHWCWEDRAWCAVAGPTTQAAFQRDGQTYVLERPAIENVHVWRAGVTEADGSVIFGLIDTRTASYSSGQTRTNELTLYRAAPEQAPIEIARLPVGGSANIRACFNSDDAQRRLEACFDDYTFDGRIELDTENADGAARLVLTTDASTYPGRRSRSIDSSQEGPLTQEDKTHWRDPECSYRIALTRGDDGRYALERPLPACADYLTL